MAVRKMWQRRDWFAFSQMNLTASLPDTPMLEDGEEGGLRLWHLVKPTEEPEATKQQQGRRSSLRERAKAIPEIYLTRLLSMKVRDKHGVFKMPPPGHPIQSSNAQSLRPVASQLGFPRAYQDKEERETSFPERKQFILLPLCVWAV